MTITFIRKTSQKECREKVWKNYRKAGEKDAKRAEEEHSSFAPAPPDFAEGKTKYNPFLGEFTSPKNTPTQRPKPGARHQSADWWWGRSRGSPHPLEKF